MNMGVCVLKIDQHHRFSQTDWAVEKYGEELIHHPKNIELISHNRHMEGKGEKWNEREYCKALGLLKCDYCVNFIPVILDFELAPCFYYEGYGAELCREFDFDLKKYEEVSDET